MSHPAFETAPPSPHCAVVTDDCFEILRFAAEAHEGGSGAALVTLVEISGGAARAMGAQMAVRGDGGYCGFVSGGCVEAAVAAEAVEAICKGLDRFVRLGEGSKFFDIRLPCGGGITLAVHVVRETGAIRAVLETARRRRPAALEYDPSRQSLEVGDDSIRTRWNDGVFVRAYRPKARICVMGRSLEASATARLAATAGFDLALSPDVSSSEVSMDPDLIDADTAVVLLFHDLDKEMPILATALGRRPFYIGALGSARTHLRRCRRLKELGFDDGTIARIRAPVGIFPKARDANALALSVLGEIASLRTDHA